jgi:hypothetical protein
MAQERPPLRATDPAFAVSDVIEALTFSFDLLNEMQTEGLDLSQLLGLHVMLLNLHLSIAQLLSVSTRQASEAARQLWAASYDQMDAGTL